MSLQVGEIFIARIVGTVVGQQYNVTHFYRVFEERPGALGAAIAQDVWELFRTEWRTLQGTYGAFLNERVEVASISDPQGIAGAYTIPGPEQVGLPGRSGEPAPPFVAFGVTLRGDSRVTRPGSRRLPFVYEGDIVNGQLAAASLSAVAAVAAEFGSVLLSNDIVVGDYAEPVIVGRTAGGQYDLTRVQRITQTTASPVLSSQTSRKQGRGV